jgi:predicted ATP-grasp superfamily ATP-dependent carboligase
MRRSLIIVGASARAAAFSAARAGFAPYAIDLFADCDLAALCPAVRIDRYPVGFLRALAEAPDAPWMYTGGLENHPRLVARLAGLRTLWGNPPSVLAEVRNPRRLAEVLREEGLPCPELWPGGDLAGRKWLVKPTRGSAGLGVRLATAADLVRPPRGTVLQEYIEGASCSATFVAAGGRAVLLGTTRQIIGRDWGASPEFLYVGSLGPLEFTDGEQATLCQLGKALANRFGLVGLFGIDFVRTAAQLWPVEVNPRYTASIEVLERLTGQQFLAHHAAACQSGMLPESPPAPRGVFAGKAVVYARRDCEWSPMGSGVFGGNHLSTMEDSPPPKTPDPFSLTWPDIADLPPAGQEFQAGQPVATVFATGESLDEVAQQLRSSEAALLATLDQHPPQ